MWADVKIYEQLVEIANQYEMFQCQACANAMRKWLEDHNVNGTYIKISAQISDFIVSERVGGYTSITKNGLHYGIEVRGKVFDNLPGTGIPKEAWLSDFDCIGGFEITETPF